MSTRKNLLLAGLGKYAATDPTSVSKFGTPEQIHKAVSEQMKTLDDQGFDCHNININPHDPEDSLSRATEVLKSKWDGFIIGFGLRGNADYTALFEKLVNLGIEMNPKIRFGFSTAPTGQLDTVDRMFPGVLKL